MVILTTLLYNKVFNIILYIAYNITFSILKYLIYITYANYIILIMTYYTILSCIMLDILY